MSKKLDVILVDEKEMMEHSEPEFSLDDILSEWKKEEQTPEQSQEIEISDAPVKPHTRRKETAKEKAGWQETVLMYLHDLTCLLAGLMLVFLLLFRVVVVSGTSMNDTLFSGDYLLLLSSSLYQDPQQGDIIVISKKNFQNGDPIVKRVIATGGQWVRIDNKTGLVYVGDTEDTMMPLEEPYTKTVTTVASVEEFKIRVDEGCLFVLGDNRNVSQDSRYPEIGLVDKREVLGKVIFLFYPGTNRNTVQPDFDRIGVVNG